MALDDLVRKGIALADKQSKPLQVTVLHKQRVSQDGFGVPVYAQDTPGNPHPNGIPRKCLMDQRIQFRNRGDGQVIQIAATLNFLERIEPQGTAARDEPIDPRDVLILPDGSTGPIVFSGGMEDPDKIQPFYLDVWIGMKGKAV